MNSTLYRSATLDRFIAPWVAKIVEFLVAIVETILAIAKTCPMPLYQPGASYRQAKRPLSVLSLAPSHAMMAKIETWSAMTKAALPTMSARCVLLADIATAPAVDQAPSAKT